MSKKLVPTPKEKHEKSNKVETNGLKLNQSRNLEASIICKCILYSRSSLSADLLSADLHSAAFFKILI